MKKVGSFRQALQRSGRAGPDDIQSSSGDSGVASLDHNDNDRSILGNDLLPKSLASFLTKNSSDMASSLRGTLKRKKEKAAKSLLHTWRDEDESTSFLATGRSSLPPPMPPVAPTPRLRRAASSTMSLGRHRKKMLTLEELYVEILYTILHMIGCDAERDEQNGLIAHLKNAFSMTDDKHTKLLDIASMREEPYLKANLEILEARELIGKDMSGSSDPFCTFYLTTNPLSRFNTSYKARTLNPVWNEDFVLDVNSVDNDSLRIDIWDFNPEENVSDKFKKIHEIKDGRGLRKFIKETLHASAGKTTHGLIGSVEVPLREVPSSGMDKWLPLEKPDARSKKKRGEVHIQLLLSTEKDQSLTSQEHKHLLKILFAFELQKGAYQPFTWNGTFSRESVSILAQHAVQGKLTGAETALARWLVYAHTHCDLPLNYEVFEPILEKLNYALKNDLFMQEDEWKFLETAVIFSHHCIEFVRKHRHYVGSESEMATQLQCIVKCLCLLSSSCEGRDLPPPSSSSTAVSSPTSPDSSFTLADISEQRHLTSITTPGHIQMQTCEAITEAFEHWYRYLVDSMPLADAAATTDLKHATLLVQTLTTDLQQGCQPFREMFRELLSPKGQDYSALAFEVYEKEVCQVARELVVTTSQSLRPIQFTDDEDEEFINDTLSVGTSLFELYLALQHMIKIGQDLFPGGRDTELMECHTWFNLAVARWLDIALYKAMQRIIKAVELDTLVPVDELVKHSSSAVDLRTVLLQIKTFWQQLSWPDAEASYAFISKILDDVCKTSIFYADHMCKRVILASQTPPAATPISRNATTKFVVTPQLCLAINNIDYVLEFIKPFARDLGTEEALERLEALDGEDVAQSCRRTLATLVRNAVENVENKIFQVLEIVGEKMAPVIQKFLVEGCSFVSYSGKNKEDLIQYLDQNMIVLKEQLNDANFDKMLSIIWDCSAQSLSDTIHLSIERSKPPDYFKTLLDILKILINFFYGDKLPQDETLLKMKSLLQLYAADSAELISRYLYARHREQRAIIDNEVGENDQPYPSLGSLTIRAQLLRDHLRIEILNARRSVANLYRSRSSRNLEWVKSKFKSLKSNLHEASLHLHSTTSAGQVDPYVTLRIVPDVAFPHCPKFKTRTQRRTLFPLFDETFDFVLGPGSGHHLHDSYLVLTVKDSGLMGTTSVFMGEALLPLAEIAQTDWNKSLKDLPQIQLPLTKPTDRESDIMLALDSRSFDPVAKRFLAKEWKKLH